MKSIRKSSSIEEWSKQFSDKFFPDEIIFAKNLEHKIDELEKKINSNKNENQAEIKGLMKQIEASKAKQSSSSYPVLSSMKNLQRELKLLSRIRGIPSRK